MQSADADNLIPGKTFEYLATGNIILALISKGATSDLLSEFDNVLIADSNDKDQIKVCIKRINNEKSTLSKIPSNYKMKLRMLTRRVQTEKLAQILNRLI